MDTLVAYAFTALSALAPHPYTSPDWPASLIETPAAYAARLHSIAEDIGAEAANKTEVGVLVGIAVHESHLAYDVDGGMTDGTACFRGTKASAKRCDSGEAWSIFQLYGRGVSKERVARWHTRRLAVHDELALVRVSRRMCGMFGPSLELAVVAGGHCAQEGEIAMRARELFSYSQSALRVMH